MYLSLLYTLFYKERLLAFTDSPLIKEGDITIKAQQHGIQELNRGDALQRLRNLISQAV